MATQRSKLKIGGSWSGVLEAELEVWTLPMLREEVAKRSNSTPDCINLICSGKVLKDGDGSAKLAELGLKNNSRILATRISADQGKALKAELLAEEERSRRLERIRWCFWNFSWVIWTGVVVDFSGFPWIFWASEEIGFFLVHESWFFFFTSCRNGFFSFSSKFAIFWRNWFLFNLKSVFYDLLAEVWRIDEIHMLGNWEKLECVWESMG